LENGDFAVYVVSDKTTPTNAQLRVRFMTMDGSTLSDHTDNIQVQPLSSKIFVQRPLAEFMNSNGTDASKMFAVTDLIVNGKPVSSNLLYFVPKKEIHLPEAQIGTELTKEGDSYRLHLSSKVLARSVYVSFGELDAKFSDNYFDLLPGTPVDITISSSAPLEQLRSNLKVMSLVDAFAPAKSPTTAEVK
ncbi:MAG TPA: glycoside hydrolase family 2 protein, partial [Terriglobales bacterium]